MNLKNITNKKVISFDWDNFSQYLKKLLEFNSENSVTPINADRWEELINAVLKYMDFKPIWNLGSHAPGADIWTDQFNISAKSGKIIDETLNISSYRLTRFLNLDEMKEFIDGDGKNFDIYLCCARTDTPQSRTYQVFLVHANIIKAKKMRWKDTYFTGGKVHSGWEGIAHNKVILNIVKNMSNQLWITIPLNLCDKILEVNISNEKLGSRVSEPLRLLKEKNNS